MKQQLVSEPSDLAHSEHFFALSSCYRDAFGVYSCEPSLVGRYQRLSDENHGKSGKHEVAIRAEIMHHNSLSPWPGVAELLLASSSLFSLPRRTRKQMLVNSHTHPTVEASTFPEKCFSALELISMF